SSSLPMLSSPSSDTARTPGTTTLLPQPRNTCSAPAPRATVAEDTVAGVLDAAVERVHTGSHRRRATCDRTRAPGAGVRSADVGRTASCASCAFLLLVW